MDRALKDTTGRYIFFAFIVGIAVSTGCAFVGYWALGRAAALNAAHHEQEKVATASLSVLQRMGSLENAPQRIEMLRALQRIKEGQEWCDAPKQALLRSTYFWAVGPEFVRLCNVSHLGLEAAELNLVNITLAPQYAALGYGAIYNDLLEYLEVSAGFVPTLEGIQQRAGRAVRWATLTITGGLLLLGGLAARLRGRTLQALRDAKASSERNKEQFQRALHGVRDGLGTADNEGKIVEANPSLKGLLSIGSANWRLGSMLQAALKEGRIQEARCDGTKMAPKEALKLAQVRPVEFDLEFDGERFVRLSCKPMPNGGTVMVAVDFTELRETNRQLAALSERLQEAQAAAEARSRIDPLTGLANRRAVDEALAAVNASDAVVVRADLDRFKAVNDAFGHAAGDAVLVHVANILSEEAEEQTLVARVGGDEFVALCPGWATLDSAMEYAARAGRRIRAPFRWHGRPLAFGVSFGAASGAELGGGATGRDVLAAADVALYRAKGSGRNTETLYTPDLHREITVRRRLIERFAAALEGKVFEPYYQPQVQSRSRMFSGLEVLARWPDSDGRVLGPNVFLPIADEMRCLPDLDAVIFEKVERDLELWRNARVVIPKIALNVSATRLGDEAFTSGVARLKRLGVQVSVELLESTLLEELDGTLDWQLDRLREAGASIEIDDFGSGHASVMGLYRVQPDCLKIDRRIVEAAASSGFEGPPEAVLRAVVEIGKALGTEIVAEGVETLDVADHVTKLGVATLQGYFFAKPLPFDAVADWIDTHSHQSRSA